MRVKWLTVVLTLSFKRGYILDIVCQLVRQWSQIATPASGFGVPFMILTPEQLSSRISSEKNIINKEEIRRTQPQVEVIIKDGINNHLGSQGAKHLTDSERVAIGTLAHSGVDQQTVADIFGISKSHVSDLKNGNRNTGDGVNPNIRIRDTNLTNQIQERLEKSKLTIAERSAEVLLASLGLITPDKLENSSAREIAQITSQLSQVVRNMSGDSNKNNDSGAAKVQIIVHAPKQTNESAFDYIEVGVK